VHSNRYTLIYAAVLSILTAVVLAVAAEGLKSAQVANVALDTKSNILKSLRLDYTERDKIEQVYDSSIEELVVNMAGEVEADEEAPRIDLKNQINQKPEDRKLPLYIYTSEGGKKYYVIPVRGTGLWGPIWGYISLEDDFNTVYGAYFDHKGETPGLGAEIAEEPFQNQFEGKKIMEDGKFVSVNVLKTTYKSPLGKEHRVDAISGGTITSNGTDAMLKNCIAPYVSYFEKVGNTKQVAVK